MEAPMSLFEEKQRKLAQAQKELEEAVADERKRLLAQRAEIDKKIAELDAVAGVKSTGTRRTGIRRSILAEIKKQPSGTTPAAIRDALNLNDPSGRSAVANALAALKKAGKIRQHDDGEYVAAST